ncbi:MAG: ABC transporter ATP-binding protein [Clostridia bacterium]
MSVAISIRNVVKRYGKETVINGLSLDIHQGEFFTLLGPSGCGKTTLLRMIIGFNTIEGGDILVDDKPINNVPTNKRNMGMVFQNYAIFPHMSVKENVAYGLKNRKVPKTALEKAVDDILHTVKIETLKDRKPTELSGGQQQRVALARAIVIHPEVLLMDEPLSNLDAKLRVEMRNAIKHIQRQVGITTVYVTHDQEEALAISDRIAVMNGGVVQQIDKPKRIYQRPANLFVASFIGLTNVLNAKLERGGDNMWVDFGSGYRVQAVDLCPQLQDGEALLAAVRPEEFYISLEPCAGIPATVCSSVFLGVNTHYFLQGKNGVDIEVLQSSELSDIIEDGTNVYLTVNMQKSNFFSAETKKSVMREGV